MVLEFVRDLLVHQSENNGKDVCNMPFPFNLYLSVQNVNLRLLMACLIMLCKWLLLHDLEAFTLKSQIADGLLTIYGSNWKSSCLLFQIMYWEVKLGLTGRHKWYLPG